MDKRVGNRFRVVSLRGGFSLVEVMLAATITALLLAILSQMFGASVDSYSKSKALADAEAEVRALFDVLAEDLSGAISGQYLDMGPQRSFVGTVAAYEPTSHMMRNRYVVPFEINRTNGLVFNEFATDAGSGTILGMGAANAVPAGAGANAHHPNYDAMNFLGIASLKRQILSSAGEGVNVLNGENINDANRKMNHGDVALMSYYVGYSYDAPVPGAKASMKIFRHFRDSGGIWSGLNHSNSTGSTNYQNSAGGQYWAKDMAVNRDYLNATQGRSFTMLMKLSRAMYPILRDGGRPRGDFSNARLPYLLSPVSAYTVNTTTFGAMLPFPINPAPTTINPSPLGTPSYADLAVAPPAPARGPRLIAGNAGYNDAYLVFGDEHIAANIIEFKIRPYRFRTGDMGGAGANVMNARDVNLVYGGGAGQNLGLAANGTEWPVIFAPDFVDVTVTVVDDETAGLFSNYSDWVNWDTMADPTLRNLVAKSARTFNKRIHVRSSDWLKNRNLALTP